MTRQQKRSYKVTKLRYAKRRLLLRSHTLHAYPSSRLERSGRMREP